MASAQASLARRSAQAVQASTKLLQNNNTKNILHGRNTTRKACKTEISSSSSSSPSFSYMKHGIGRLTASYDNHLNQSKLTQVSHKAPMRWLPLQSSRVEQAGASIAAMSNYGAGLLSGDVNQVYVKVQPRARLGILTQGSNRIYKQKTASKFHRVQGRSPATTTVAAAKSTLQATVHQNGLLVVAPDPTVPFAQSSFYQQQEFVIHPTASLIAIDWVSSGRFANGERWQANQVSLETKLKLFNTTSIDDDDGGESGGGTATSSLLVWDATTLSCSGTSSHGCNNNNNNTSSSFGFDLGQESFNAYASMLLYGNQSLSVVQQLQELQHQLAAPYTRLRRQSTSAIGTTTADADELDLVVGTTLAGRVLLGVNELQDDHDQPVYVARWAASSNEDLYRMLHHSLKPLAPLFGLEFYQDRIRATSSSPSCPTTIVAMMQQQKQQQQQTNGNTYHHHHHHHHVVNRNEEAVATSSSSSSSIANIPTQEEGASSMAALSWNAYMLADSALPTGSFAHSAGLEAASQLGLLVVGGGEEKDSKNKKMQHDDNHGNKSGSGDDPSNHKVSEQNVQTFIEASTRSTLQQATPWILSGHEIAAAAAASWKTSSSPTIIDDVLAKQVEQWEQLERHVHAVMVCSAPACRASIDQGRNLLRVAIPWLKESSKNNDHHAALSLLLESIHEHIKARSSSASSGGGGGGGHMAPLFGILANALDLTPQDSCHLLGYCVARDIVSAAVRLNLIGPLKSVAMLSNSQAAAQEGIQMGLQSSSPTKGEDAGNNEDDRNLLWSNGIAGGCAPIVDAIHPCHDLLAVRLFRT